MHDISTGRECHTRSTCSNITADQIPVIQPPIQPSNTVFSKVDSSQNHPHHTQFPEGQLLVKEYVSAQYSILLNFKLN